MTRRFGLIVGLFMFTSVLGFGRDSNLERGGLGFVFPDHNSFANPGQFATSHGMAVQAAYGSDTKVTGETGDLSAVFGNGMVGLGIDANRMAPNVTKSTNAFDTVTAAGGVSLVKERLTLGGSYSRGISAGNQGIGLAEGTLTLNSPNRHGPSLGVGYTTTVNSPVKMQGVIAGIGYAFHSNNTVEANVHFNDTKDWKNYDASGFFTVANAHVYASGGYTYHALAKQSEVVGRIGAVLGMRFDVSATVGYLIVSGNPIDYGASARISF